MRLGELIYAGAKVLALLCAVGLIFINIFFVGGGMLPNVGAIFIASVVLLIGRFVKALLSIRRRD